MLRPGTIAVLDIVRSVSLAGAGIAALSVPIVTARQQPAVVAGMILAMSAYSLLTVRMATATRRCWTNHLGGYVYKDRTPRLWRVVVVAWLSLGLLLGAMFVLMVVRLSI